MASIQRAMQTAYKTILIGDIDFAELVCYIRGRAGEPAPALTRNIFDERKYYVYQLKNHGDK